MSFLSDGLAHLGISKSAQRAVTKPLLVAAGPLTGGASLAALPFVNTPGNNGAIAPPPITDTQNPLVQSILAMAGFLNPPKPAVAAPVAAPVGFFSRNKIPLLLGGAGIVGVGALIYFAKR